MNDESRSRQERAAEIAAWVMEAVGRGDLLGAAERLADEIVWLEDRVARLEHGASAGPEALDDA